MLGFLCTNSIHLSKYSLALLHLHRCASSFWNSLAVLLGNRGTLLVRDSVADLPGNEVHHSPLFSASDLHSVHNRHLDSVAQGFWHVGTLLVVYGVALGPGHHVPLGPVLEVTRHFHA